MGQEGSRSWPKRGCLFDTFFTRGTAGRPSLDESGKCFEHLRFRGSGGTPKWGPGPWADPSTTPWTNPSDPKSGFDFF